jgi:hypothetical protein
MKCSHVIFFFFLFSTEYGNNFFYFAQPVFGYENPFNVIKFISLIHCIFSLFILLKCYIYCMAIIYPTVGNG